MYHSTLTKDPPSRATAITLLSAESLLKASHFSKKVNIGGMPLIHKTEKNKTGEKCLSGAKVVNIPEEHPSAQDTPKSKRSKETP